MSAVLAMACLLPACRTTAPATVSLATLVAEREAYVGRQVRTEGVVRRFIDPSGPYFVIEDANRNRVALTPAPRVASFRGRRVEVVGTFEFAQTRGRFIDVEEVRMLHGDGAPTEAASPAASSKNRARRSSPDLAKRSIPPLASRLNAERDDGRARPSH